MTSWSKVGGEEASARRGWVVGVGGPPTASVGETLAEV